jgi:hypothetical protein
MTASPPPDESSSIVSFEGNWSVHEKDLVGEAVAQAETDELPSYAHFQSSPWVATCHNQGETDVYAVSRIGVSRVMSARSASDLAEQIRQFARSESTSDDGS